MIRVEVNYWKADNPTVFSSDNFPVFLACGESEGFYIYGLPIEEYPELIKVAFLAIIIINPRARMRSEGLL